MASMFPAMIVVVYAAPNKLDPENRLLNNLVVDGDGDDVSQPMKSLFRHRFPPIDCTY